MNNSEVDICSMLTGALNRIVATLFCVMQNRNDWSTEKNTAVIDALYLRVERSAFATKINIYIVSRVEIHHNMEYIYIPLNYNSE